MRRRARARARVDSLLVIVRNLSATPLFVRRASGRAQYPCEAYVPLPWRLATVLAADACQRCERAVDAGLAWCRTRSNAYSRRAGCDAADQIAARARARRPLGPRDRRRASSRRRALARRRACRAGRRGSGLRCPSCSTSRAGSALSSGGGRASARSFCSREPCWLCCSSSVVWPRVRGGVARTMPAPLQAAREAARRAISILRSRCRSHCRMPVLASPLSPVTRAPRFYYKCGSAFRGGRCPLTLCKRVLLKQTSVRMVFTRSTGQGSLRRQADGGRAIAATEHPHHATPRKTECTRWLPQEPGLPAVAGLLPALRGRLKRDVAMRLVAWRVLGDPQLRREAHVDHDDVAREPVAEAVREPAREVEQLGQRKPLPRRPRCRGSAGRRLDARRPSRAPSGLQARARAASGQPFRSPRGRVGGRARAAPRAADTRLALPALRARRPRAQPPSSRGWRHTLAGQIAQPPTSRKIRPAGRGGRLGR